MWLFLFVPQISLEQLNGFSPNWHGRRVWSLARTNLNFKVKVTRDKERAVHSHHPLAAYKWHALAANSVQRQRMAPFHPCRGGGGEGVLLRACMRFMFGETYLSLVLILLLFITLLLVTESKLGLLQEIYRRSRHVNTVCLWVTCHESVWVPLSLLLLERQSTLWFVQSKPKHTVMCKKTHSLFAVTQ